MALRLFAQPGLEDNLAAERQHLAILERVSIAKELALLQEQGSGVWG